MSEPHRKETKAEPPPPDQLPSSPGDSPVELTPLDVDPDDVTWKDRTPRKLTSPDPDERVEAILDEAVELTFPASDPIAVPSCTKVSKGTKPGAKELKELDDAIAMTFPASDPIAPPSDAAMQKEAELRKESAHEEETGKDKPEAAPRKS